MAVRRIVLELDETDYELVQAYFAETQVIMHGTLMIGRGGNIAGALVADAVREVLDLRDTLDEQMDEMEIEEDWSDEP